MHSNSGLPFRNNWEKEQEGVQWVLGIQSHKQAPQMLRFLMTPNDIAWIVPIPNHESWNKRQLSNACPELAKQLFEAKEVEEVFSNLLIHNEWPTPPPVIVGSLYLIDDLLMRDILEINSKY